MLKLKLDELPEDEKPVNLTAHYIPLSPDLENVNGGIPYDVSLLILLSSVV